MDETRYLIQLPSGKMASLTWEEMQRMKELDEYYKEHPEEFQKMLDEPWDESDLED